MPRQTRPGVRFRAAGFFLLLFAAVAMAWPGEETERALTLQEVVTSADQAPELIAARAGEAVAEALVRVSHKTSDLEVSMMTNSVTAHEAAAVLVPLPWPARGRRIEAATAHLATATRTREEALATARQALRTAWFTLAAARERAAAAADREARARRNAEAVSALYEEGRVAHLEQVRASAEASLALSERVSEEERHRGAAAALLTLMGLDPKESVSAAAPLPAPEEEPSLEESVVRAREGAPAVRTQAAAAEAAAAEWRLAQRLRAPGLGLILGADWSDPTQSGTNSYAGVRLIIPVAGSAITAAAASARDQQAALLEQARREAEVAVQSAWRSTRAARLKFEAIDQEVLPASQQAADLARLAYQEGRVDLFRLLDAERLLTEAQVSRADSYEEWGTAHAELLRLTAQDAP